MQALRPARGCDKIAIGAGIRPRARRIERAGAGEARHADFPFHLRVIGLKVGVGNRPVGETRSGDWADFAALDEVDFVEAPKICGEMDAGATDQAAVDDRALGLGFFVGRLAKRVGLQLGMIRKQVFAQYLYFVVGEVGFGKVRALLQDYNAEAVFRQFLGDDAAGGPGAYDHEIDFVRRLVLRLFGGHDLVLSVAVFAGCQPA
jgi:hypothetical protein